ncbi:hypothetical protein QC762_0022010 [Podospora pseudocomata]|uniref:Uncharacterized protein n=1 Tax=Podospora pseudocomata TaxID=2093779 RepID=A0ABR0GYN0_9PEZI|nr:hypothetical protein QC762_0022010 [Podospora pseudocomata]
MDDHSFLFKFVPTEDKYISLLTGVVASVVKASVNYQKIAEGFSLALVEMSENLRFVQKKTKVANTREMQRLVVALYVQVFKFLCHAMSFFHKRHKRFLASFNKGFYDKTVKAMVDGIQKTIGDIRNEAQHTTELRIEYMHQRFNDMEPVLVTLQRLGIQAHADSQQQVNAKLAAAALGFQRLGENAVQQLEGLENQATHDIAAQPPQRTSNILPISSAEESANKPEMPTYKPTAKLSNGGESANPTQETIPDCQRIQQYAEALRIYIESDAELHIDEFRRQQTMIPEEVYTALRRWIFNTESRMMWIEGPSLPGVSTLSKIAVTAVNQVMNAQLPCIAHFCKSRYSFARSDSRSGLNHSGAAVISLFYSIIRQLTYLLSTQGPITGISLDYREFEKLDGKLHSLPTALSIMRALLEHAPPTITWVIDGLQYARDQVSNGYLWDFTQLLREQKTKRLCKVLFTTSGRSQVLDRCTTVQERADASRLVQARGGRAYPGGMPL